MVDTMLKTALILAERGLKILPVWKPEGKGCSCPLGENCPSPGKHPATKTGVRDATTGKAKITEWFQDGRYNLGVTGHTAFLILDFDTSASYYEWEAEQPELARTLTVQSGSGDGFHVYVALEEGTDIKNYTHKYGEVRGFNQYVVAPPSLHKSGGLYTFITPDWENAPILTARPDQLPKRKGAQVTVNAGDVVFGDKPASTDVLVKFTNDLNPFTMEYIFHPTGDRSEGDWAVVRDLLRLGATNHEIWSVFELFPVGSEGKYGEKNKRDRINYLRLTIAKAREALNREMVEIVESKEGEAVIGLGISVELAGRLLNFSGDDDGNARAFMAMYPGKFIHTKSFGWMLYNGRFWQREGAEAEVQKGIMNLFNARRILAAQASDDDPTRFNHIYKASIKSTNNRNNVLAMVMMYLTDDTRRFDTEQHLLNANNGVINLRTGELLPHGAEYYFTYCMSTDYKPEAVSKRWEGFLRETMGNKEKGLVGNKLEDFVEWLQMAVGYSFTGETSEEVLFFVHGPARSGKGTFANTLSTLIGQPLALSTDFATFTEEKTDPNGYKIAPLRNTRLVVASESGGHDWLNSEITKRITGRDEMQARYLYQDFFYFYPQWTIWLFSNFPVKGDPEDRALWGRVRVVEFPNSHLGQEDKSLKNDLTSRANLEGILAWVVEGAVKWYRLGGVGLHTPDYVKLLTEAHREEVDYVAQWLKLNYVEDAEAFMPSDTLYNSYKEYCEEIGVRFKSKPILMRSLAQRGFEVVRTYHAKKQMRGVFGLKKETLAQLREVA